MADYDVIVDMVRHLTGDSSFAFWPAAAIYYGIRAAIERYGAICARVETQVLQLAQNGVWAQPLSGWTGDELEEVVYVHWPAAASIPAVTAENKVLDYWYYFHGAKPSSVAQTVYLDLKVDGTTLPAAGDYILVSGICRHRVNGMNWTHVASSDAATFTTIPVTHWGVIALGAAAYCLRSWEINRAVEASSTPVAFISAYHIGIMADMAERYMRDFEAELYLLAQKRLDRPIWGDPERRRLQRLTELGAILPRPRAR